MHSNLKKNRIFRNNALGSHRKYSGSVVVTDRPHDSRLSTVLHHISSLSLSLSLSLCVCERERERGGNFLWGKGVQLALDSMTMNCSGRLQESAQAESDPVWKDICSVDVLSL